MQAFVQKRKGLKDVHTDLVAEQEKIVINLDPEEVDETEV